jgi:hypothetical protein
MSAIIWPAGLRARAFSLTLVPVQRAHASPIGGSEQVVDMVNDRWHASFELPATRRTHGGQAEGFIASLRGMINTVALWHMARPLPLGTLRGAPTLNGAHAQGAATLSITTIAGATLKQGDLLGLGGLLLMVASDCTADGAGVISAPLANRLRTAQSTGAAITWHQPAAPFRMVGAASVGYVPGSASPVALEFVEAIA